MGIPTETELRAWAKAELEALPPEEVLIVTHSDPRVAALVASLGKRFLIDNFDLLMDTVGEDIKHHLLTGEETHDGRDRLAKLIREGNFRFDTPMKVEE